MDKMKFEVRCSDCGAGLCDEVTEAVQDDGVLYLKIKPCPTCIQAAEEFGEDKGWKTGHQDGKALGYDLGYKEGNTDGYEEGLTETRSKRNAND